MRVWPIVSAVLLLSAPLAAEETRRLAPEAEPAPATLEDVVFLIGRWSGEGIGGAEAHEHWFPPTGTTMVGTFIQEDAEGGISFTEHLYIVEEEGTLVLRLKHFNPDLSSWEEREDTTDFRFVEAEPCAAYFNGLTLKCDGQDGLLAAVAMQRNGQPAGELVFRFKRQD